MMVMLLRALLLALSLAASFSAYARPAAPSCSEPAWGKECFVSAIGFGALKAEYLNRVKFSRIGVAVLSVGPFESVAINRKGEIIVPGIVTGDFDYTEAENGIAAFYTPKTSQTESKCGYFQVSNFKIVIPPSYDICARFHRKKAYVCVDCKLDCADCHSYEYYGSRAYVINQQNQVLKQVTLPKLPRCSTVKERGGFPPSQKCRPDGDQRRS